MVFFEAPHRLATTLEAMADVFGGERPAAVCRELTKTYEEVRRGTLGELAAGAEGVRGEVTLVITGASGAAIGPPSDAALGEAVAELVKSGSTRRDAVDAVAARFGLPRRTVYAVGHRS